MIARICHGRAAASKGDAYVDYLKVSGVRELQETKGNRGVLLLRKSGPDAAEFLVISLWESYEDIKAFAGSDLEKARYFERDDQFLLEFEPKVSHYEVHVGPSEL